jgi:hypothetical protein
MKTSCYFRLFKVMFGFRDGSCYLVAVTLIVTVLPLGAQAQRAPGPRLALMHGQRPAANERLEEENELLALRAMMLEEDLCSLQRPMRKYTYAWLGALSAVLVAQGAYALTLREVSNEAERATRAGLFVAMGMTVGGITALAAMRKPEIRACDDWHALAADPKLSLRERVAFGEARLARSELSARRQTGWWLHGVAVALGTAVGVGLGLGFPDNALRATTQGVGTFALTEARILTRPTRARRFLREYRALRWNPKPAP